MVLPVNREDSTQLLYYLLDTLLRKFMPVHIRQPYVRPPVAMRPGRGVSQAASHRAVPAAVQWLVLLCEKKLLVRHVFLAASLRAPVRTAAVYIPVSTYAAVYPIDILRIVVGCCPVYAPAVLPKGAGVGTTFVLSC